jgi:hypothetical protein
MRRSGWKGASLVLTALLLFGAAQTARAEVQKLEAVGTVPVRGGEVATRDTRDAAVSEALREAVLRVARELLIDAALAEEYDDAALAGVLGKQVLPYTNRYRIIDDQGERPALFGDDPDAASEYVVIVEVSIETDRVEQRLVEAGLLVREAGNGETTRLRVEVRGLLHYPGVLAMQELLGSESGAVSVQPVSFERGRAVIELELSSGPEPADRRAFARRLVEAGPPELTIEAVRIDDEAFVLAATWTPQPPADADEYD